MANKTQTGIWQYLEARAWVIVVDIVGFALLLSLLLTAGGAPALKDWMFVLLTVIPVMALITMLIPPRKTQPAAAVIPARPAIERKIFIASRPYDQRAQLAA